VTPSITVLQDSIWEHRLSVYDKMVIKIPTKEKGWKTEKYVHELLSKR